MTERAKKAVLMSDDIVDRDSTTVLDVLCQKHPSASSATRVDVELACGSDQLCGVLDLVLGMPFMLWPVCSCNMVLLLVGLRYLLTHLMFLTDSTVLHCFGMFA